jgi:hypothetical protein
VEGYADWLVGYVREDRRRQVLFVLGLSALASNPTWVGEILNRYEQAWLAQEDFKVDGAADGPGAELVIRSLSEEKELTAAAKLSWVRHVRQEFMRLAEEEPVRAPARRQALPERAT